MTNVELDRRELQVEDIPTCCNSKMDYESLWMGETEEGRGYSEVECFQCIFCGTYKNPINGNNLIAE